jgi:acetyl esterase
VNRAHRVFPHLSVPLLLRAAAIFAVAIATCGCTTLGISPRPTAALIQFGFDKGGVAMSKALEKHVPAGVEAVLDEHYDAGDADAYLDVFYPSQAVRAGTALPTVVWVHGGAWVSGGKEQIANYLRILASRGYTMVGVGYSIAPRKIYPAPLQQVNAALAYLQANAKRLHVDPSRIYLAGDSAGAQIAAQLANIVSVPAYARTVGVAPSIERAQLRGVLLYCGAYDIGQVDFSGASGVFLKTVLWSYAGTKDFATDARFAPASVLNFVTPAFPPAFISAGNADPLEPQSRAMSQALAKQKVAVESLFYAPGQVPALPHEYQFDLDTEAGQQALERSVKFLSSRSQ